MMMAINILLQQVPYQEFQMAGVAMTTINYAVLQ